jgi:hypothetical protein
MFSPCIEAKDGIGIRRITGAHLDKATSTGVNRAERVSR